jgi:hypothetical protein
MRGKLDFLINFMSRIRSRAVVQWVANLQDEVQMRMRGAGRGNGDAYWVDGGKGWGRGVIGCMRGERQEMAFEGEVWGVIL